MSDVRPVVQGTTAKSAARGAAGPCRGPKVSNRSALLRGGACFRTEPLQGARSARRRFFWAHPAGPSRALELLGRGAQVQLLGPRGGVLLVELPVGLRDGVRG